MRIIIYALLVAGLFFSCHIFADMDKGGIDWTKETSLIDGYLYRCNGYYNGNAVYVGTAFSQLADCLSPAASAVSAKLPALPKSTTTDLGNGGSQKTQVSITALSKPSPLTPSGYSVGFKIVQTTTQTTCSGNIYGVPVCSSSSPSVYTYSISGSVSTSERKTGKVCPPTHPNQKTNEKGETKCYADLPPIGCDEFQGLSSNKLVDKFEATTGIYSKDTPPHCLRTCHTNKDGYEQCGYCKVVAKSWSSTSAGNREVWWANVGTFTGTSCGAKDDIEPPKEPPPVCWKTKNGLDMCQADPDKKCQTINGIRQCKAGCGEVNGDFFCKTDERPPRDFDKTGDKELPKIDDTITNPEKSINDMQKGDFKDVLKGVETRVSASIQGMANIENSVDSTNNTLKDIKDIADTQTTVQEAQLAELGEINSKLGEIADGMGSEGNGDGQGGGEDDSDSEGSGECDPKKSAECASGGVRSWWNSPYKDGLNGLMKDKLEQFERSDVYKSLTQPLDIGGGGASPKWNICLNFGFADYGCEDLSVPDYLWHFIKACFLFSAAILCRRLLIGA